jgi:nucleotide-binding universal stress UspA family protein
MGSEMKDAAVNWSRILAPLAGGDSDKAVLAAAALIAAPFGAEVAGVFAPADVADLMPWMGEGFMGGVQIAAVESLKEAAIEGRKGARSTFDALAYEPKIFKPLDSPVWTALSMESRLSDVVVFDNEAARGRGPLAPAFQQIIAVEQRPVVIPRPGLDPAGAAVVAWDGGKEATRAVRTALPLLQQAKAVTILAAESSALREFDPSALRDFLAKRGVSAHVHRVAGSGEAAPVLLKTALELGASLFVAGAYGHPRLQEFIFGGATRTFLNAEAPSLFLSH